MIDINEIEQAYESGDLIHARSLIEKALRQAPSSQIYFLAAKTSIETGQKVFYLQKALELDPFYEPAYIELGQLQVVPLKSEVNPTGSIAGIGNTIPSSSYLAQFSSASTSYPSPVHKKGRGWIWLIVGLVTMLVGGIILATLSNSSVSASSNQYSLPEATATPKPSATPVPQVLASAVSKGDCKLPEVTTASYKKGPIIQGCVTPKLVGQFQKVTLLARLLVDGKPVPYAEMKSYWNYRYFPETYNQTADSKGLVTQSVNTGIITVDFPVLVDLTFRYQGQTIQLNGTTDGSTTFLPVE